MTDAIMARLLAGADLSEEESYESFAALMDGGVHPARAAAFLALLRRKGERSAEIAGAARLMRERAVRVRCPAGVAVDTCGTGGDRSGTFNISTAAALLVAACGVRVAKHGNRSATSACGSADAMESLGYPIDLSPDAAERLLETVGFAFLFAPLYHRAMKNVAEVRKALGFRTIFNILGPLCNPAFVPVQVMGVYDPALLDVVAEAFARLGISGYVLCGEDCVDEVTLTARTVMVRVAGGTASREVLDPAEFGMARCRREDLAGGTAAENAAAIRGVLEGRERGPRRDVVLLNAAVVLAAAGSAGSVAGGLRTAADAVDSGRAAAKLEEIVRCAASA